ncbi:MAG: tRNA preQ1(34) S-adenosylmethionine ribosyltransferase-isomerase QueA [Planctomycetota bacterium]|nr:MAG: tRNA preQ1(34) S-adenosylmethionine ribosyltransferase-isomerase QueA [Planctomycetota bacterium]
MNLPPAPENACQPADLSALSSYDYSLPPELIAEVPLDRRDASRLLVVDRLGQALTHGQFADLPQWLRAGDLLVLNETRVLPARLRGVRGATGGKWEGLFLGVESRGDWRLIGQTRGKLQVGEELHIPPPQGSAVAHPLRLKLQSRAAEGEWLATPEGDPEVSDPFQRAQQLLEQYGKLPLPPYIEREVRADLDTERYQTMYARTPGAIAAPTAGLHFTPEVFAACRALGVETATLTLHVGIGTFRPVAVERLADHVMHSEWCELPAVTVAAIERTRARGGRVIAVGTTSARTLESIAATGPLRPWSGETNLFIRPPYEFRVIDGLITNFHLPKSTLLVLVSTLAGRDLMLRAYREAIARQYRFFSYGDAMLIVR